MFVVYRINAFGTFFDIGRGKLSGNLNIIFFLFISVVVALALTLAAFWSKFSIAL